MARELHVLDNVLPGMTGLGVGGGVGGSVEGTVGANHGASASTEDFYGHTQARDWRDR